MSENYEGKLSVMSSDGIVRYARGAGITVVDGGKHGKKLRSDHGTETDLPCHGARSPINKWTAASLIKWIEKRRIKRLKKHG